MESTRHDASTESDWQMSRRLTDTDKWQDPWFRKLTPPHKMLWLFFLDHCDIAGVFDWDQELVEFLTGLELTTEFEAFITACNGRVVQLRNGKFWIPKFIEFQQKTTTLNLSNNCHYGIVKALQHHGITPQEHGYAVEGLRRGSLGASEGLPSPTGKGKGKGNKGGPRGGTRPTPEQVQAYCEERNRGVDPETWFDYYAAQGWQLANGRPMKDWQAAVRTWENRNKPKKQIVPTPLSVNKPHWEAMVARGELTPEQFRKKVADAQREEAEDSANHASAPAGIEDLFA